MAIWAASPVSGATWISNVSRFSAWPIELGDLAGDRARGEPLRPLRERNLLAGTQLVHRLVEDDQREDVGLLERRRAGQHDFGLLQRAAHVDPGLDTLDQPPRTQIEERVQLFGADELHRAVAQDLEAAALEVVVAANGVHGARPAGTGRRDPSARGCRRRA